MNFNICGETRKLRCNFVTSKLQIASSKSVNIKQYKLLSAQKAFIYIYTSTRNSNPANCQYSLKTSKSSTVKVMSSASANIMMHSRQQQILCVYKHFELCFAVSLRIYDVSLLAKFTACLL